MRPTVSAQEKEEKTVTLTNSQAPKTASWERGNPVTPSFSFSEELFLPVSDSL
jgi:hypothetical protein